MPKKRSAPLLRRMCLEKVALNMRYIWAGDYIINRLASSFVKELLQLMCEEDLLTSSVLHSLLLPQLSELDLGICPELVTESSIQITTVCCKNLSSLNLSGCIQIPEEALIDLVKSLPHLTKLDLSKTQCNTEVLSALGSCCCGLRELDISLCEEVTQESLLHLVCDPATGALCCQELQTLQLCTLKSTTNEHELVWVLVFVLLALPNLKYLIHDSVVDAVCLIYYQHLSSTRIFPGFPSLAELARFRVPDYLNEGGSSLSLALKEIYAVDEYSWPMACAVCPHLEEVSLFLRDSPDLGQSFTSWGSLVHLTINCKERRDLKELWPVTRNLGGQLRILAIEGFSLDDELSFYTLLNDCQNLKHLRVTFFPPVQSGNIRMKNIDAFSSSLPPLKFPRLSSLYLMQADVEDLLPAEHGLILKTSLTYLLKYSPNLQSLDLVCLTISLDEVFQMVLTTPNSSLLQLQKLYLIQDDDISMNTIDLLLSSKNELNCLKIDTCSKICETDLEKVLQKVVKENLDLNVVWE
uniref:F-box/LRR-repeat protein 15-like leucin rich repeat domain-containing protein n=1 Tax=Anolis carolinensis TaxID=28377 RepID=A0A803T463_ANOCA|nr:PREDICTED: uncharacterized protein LOC103281662 [Anolis carolinensis]|eukprot:XP_008121899.1 PREDICTED: uncharacterized protein LOC103281662 [Anolis carolinensis]